MISIKLDISYPIELDTIVGGHFLDCLLVYCLIYSDSLYSLRVSSALLVHTVQNHRSFSPWLKQIRLRVPLKSNQSYERHQCLRTRAYTYAAIQTRKLPHSETISQPSQMF